MARKSLVFMALLMIMFSTLISSANGRKLLMNARRRNEFPTADATLFLAALPKGTVPVSGPSKKGHANTIDEKLIARHLYAVDRIPRGSVPSPGVGH